LRIASKFDPGRCLAALALLACLVPEPASGGGDPPAQWRTVETRYVTLWYQSEATLSAFERKIAYSADSGSFASLFSSRQDSDLNAAVARKMEALFEKVQEILDMKKPMKKVRVRIYPDQGSLRDAYLALYKTDDQVRAWYIFEFNTIYVTAEDLSEGMLAHEMAHAIIDNFMAVRPPRNTAEILARYVDQHLFEEVKRYR
jgi:hypothetical protein